MERGADRERLTFTMTKGRRMPEATKRISDMSIRPWEEVAVKVLTPEAAAPMQALRALCSDSTLIISASSSPLAMYSESFSTTAVWGVMG